MTSNLNNTYRLLLANEPTVIAIEKQFNATINTSIALINTTKADANRTIVGFLTNINATYNSFIGKVPAAIKSTPGYSNGIAFVNGVIQQIRDISYALRDQLFSDLEMSKANFYNIFIDNYYNDIFWYVTQMRYDVFGGVVWNYNTYNCGVVAVNAFEAKMKALGGPTALTNCTNVLDMNLFARLNSSLTTLINLAFSDITQTSALFAKCLGTRNLTTSTTNPPLYPYSVMDCLENVTIFFDYFFLWKNS
jgi:hypothetical protein